MRVLLAACVALIVGGCIADGGGRQPGSGETTNSSCEVDYYFCVGGYEVHRDPNYDSCNGALSGNQEYISYCDCGCSASGEYGASCDSCDSGSGDDSCQAQCEEQCGAVPDPPDNCHDLCAAELCD